MSKDLSAYSDEELAKIANAPQQNDKAGMLSSLSDDELEKIAYGERPERSALDYVRDPAVALSQGIVDLGSAAVGLADIPTGGRVGKAMKENLGYDPRATNQFLEGLYSPAQQYVNRKVSDAEGFVGTAKEVLSNPSSIAMGAVRSVPSWFGGGAAAQGLTKAGVVASPVIAGAIGEGLIGAGTSAEDIRQEQGTLGPKQIGSVVASGALTGAIGAIGGRIAQRFGFGDPDTMLAAGGLNKTNQGIVKRILGGGMSEGLFEELPQSMQEQVWMNAATDRPLMEGVGAAGAQGGIVGAAVGGAANIPARRVETAKDDTPPEVPQKQPVQNNAPRPSREEDQYWKDQQTIINAQRREAGMNKKTPAQQRLEDAWRKAAESENAAIQRGSAPENAAWTPESFANSIINKTNKATPEDQQFYENNKQEIEKYLAPEYDSSIQAEKMDETANEQRGNRTLNLGGQQWQTNPVTAETAPAMAENADVKKANPVNEIPQPETQQQQEPLVQAESPQAPAENKIVDNGQAKFIQERVKALGSIEAVNKAYPGDDAVSQFARTAALSEFATPEEMAQKADANGFILDDGTKVTSTGKAKKPAPRGIERNGFVLDEAEAAEVGKPAYQQTQAEYIQDFLKRNPSATPEYIDEHKRMHRGFVEQAMARGDVVPKAVLDEYGLGKYGMSGSRKDYFSGLTIGEKTLKHDLEVEKNTNGATFRFTKFNALGSDYFAIETDRQGWKGGKEYSVRDAAGNNVQSMVRGDKRISFIGSSKNRKDVINRFKTLTDDGWEPVDSFYYDQQSNKKEATDGLQEGETEGAVGKKPSGVYYEGIVSNGKVVDFKPVNDAKKIEIFPGVETFIKKGDRKRWSIHEARTGLRIGEGGSRAKAIESSKNAVEITGGVEKLNELIESAGKKNGFSPWDNGAKLSTTETKSGITPKQAAEELTKRGFKANISGDTVTVKTPSGEIRINVADSIVENDSATIKLAYGREAKPGEKVAGSYFDGTVILKRDLADKYILSHELYHHMYAAGLFTKAEMSILNRKGDEEAQARWVEDKIRRRGEFKGMIRQIAQKVMDFIDAIRSVFLAPSGTKKQKLVDVAKEYKDSFYENRLLGKIDSGDILRREPGAKADTGLRLSTKEPNQDGSRYAITSKIEEIASSLTRPFNDFMYWMVDKNHPISTIQTRLRNVGEKIDVFLKETQRPKRNAARVQKFWDFDVKPFILKTAEYKFNVQDVEEYAHAMHVIGDDLNADLARRNSKRYLDEALKVIDEDTAAELKRKFKGQNTPAENYGNLMAVFDMYEDEDSMKSLKDSWDKFTEKPSGMTNEEAQKILDHYKGNKKIEELRQMLSDMNSERLDIYYNSGLLPKEEYKAIKQKYKYYIPLQREGFDDSLFGSSRGLNPSGRAVKTRMGSNRKVVNIVANSVAGMERAINASEKARSTEALLGLVKSNPDPTFWSVSEENKTPRYDKLGNIHMYPDITNVKNNEFRFMVNGKQYFLEVNKDDKDAMNMLKTLKASEHTAGPIVNTLAKLNQFFAKINTTYAPEFIISNFIRDLQTAGINIKDTGVKKDNLLKGAMAAGISIYNVERGKQKGTKLEKLYERFKEAGGKIGWADVHGTVENLAKKIQAEVEMQSGKRPAQKLVNDWLKLIGDANTSIENGIRLHTFKLATEQGFSDEKAAQIASDLTVDFTKKGAAGPVINSLYLFANAGIQGSYRILRAATKSKAVQKHLAAIIGAGFTIGILNSMFGGTDDDGEDYYNKIDDFIKERNLIIMLPGTKGRYAKIPLPWGYNVFWNIGAEVSRAFTEDGYSPLSSAARLATTTFSAFNPIYSGTFLQSISPTVADPFVQVAENKNWFGSDLMPQDSPYSKVPKPDSQKYWKSTGKLSVGLTEMMNELTGGNKVKSGFIDVSPETVDLIVDTMGGSALRFFRDIIGTPHNLITEGEFELRTVPFARRVLGDQPQWANSKIYYKNVENVLTVKEQLKAYRGTPAYEDIMKSTVKERSMIGMAETFEKRLRNMRKILRSAEASNNKKAIEEINKNIEKLYTTFNRKYKETVYN